MRSWKALREIAVVLATCGLFTPPSLVVAQLPTAVEKSAPHTASAVAQDVALDDNGLLQGVVVNNTGVLQTGVDVAVYAVSDYVVVGKTSTDAAGRFQLRLTQGGVYRLVAGDRSLMLRCWAGSTAPPCASQQLMVAVDQLHRGQISPAACGLGSPWVMAGLVAAAIIIPVAIHNNREDRASASE